MLVLKVCHQQLWFSMTDLFNVCLLSISGVTFFPSTFQLMVLSIPNPCATVLIVFPSYLNKTKCLGSNEEYTFMIFRCLSNQSKGTPGQQKYIVAKTKELCFHFQYFPKS